METIRRQFDTNVIGLLETEVIYRAATDGFDQLRYPAGADAQSFLDKRHNQDDHTFMTETLANVT